MDRLILERKRVLSEERKSLSSNIRAEDILKLFINHLKCEHNLGNDDIRRMISETKEEIMIPACIFNDKLSALETVTKYLNENLNLKNKRISEILNRNVRTIWATYNNAIKKYSKRIIVQRDNSFFIPASKFKNRVYSNLEVIVRHLKEEYDLSFHNIAVILMRSESTIWTVYNRALKKDDILRKKERKSNNKNSTKKSKR